MKLNKVGLAISALIFSGSVLAHGYISEPASRDEMCRNTVSPNLNCGQAVYEPQSTGEGPDGFPASGPKDGELASGSGDTNWIGTALNAQSSDRWVKHKVEAGPMDVTWTFTAAHPIADYKYYITKQNWNPNQALTRDSFELTPFCVIPGGPAESSGKATHTCNLPERTGYQVIYAAWNVSDTPATFYKIIDVEYDEVASVWKRNIGSILPSRQLETGDSVKARFFDANGEREDLSVTLNIESAEAGEANNWSLALANKVNATHENIRAGVKNSEGDVVPVAGTNTVYTLQDSPITRVEIQVTAQEDTRPGIELSNTKDQYTIGEGTTVIEFDVKAVGEVLVNAKAYNDKQENVGFGSDLIKDTTKALPMKFWDAKPGKHTIVVDGKLRDGTTFQKDFEMTFVENSAGNYDFTFPQGIDQYKAGTKVLQQKTNKVFECKQGPVAGWCKIYSASANQYEPGVGSNWQDAWVESNGAHHH